MQPSWGGNWPCSLSQGGGDHAEDAQKGPDPGAGQRTAQGRGRQGREWVDWSLARVTTVSTPLHPPQARWFRPALTGFGLQPLRWPCSLVPGSPQRPLDHDDAQDSQQQRAEGWPLSPSPLLPLASTAPWSLAPVEAAASSRPPCFLTRAMPLPHLRPSSLEETPAAQHRLTRLHRCHLQLSPCSSRPDLLSVPHISQALAGLRTVVLLVPLPGPTASLFPWEVFRAQMPPPQRGLL